MLNSEEAARLLGYLVLQKDTRAQCGSIKAVRSAPRRKRDRGPRAWD